MLTAPPNAHVGGAPVSATAGIGTTATLEGGVGNDGHGTDVPVHDLAIFDVEDMPQGREAANHGFVPDHGHSMDEPEDDGELIGAPSTSEDEVEFDEFEEPIEEEDVDFAEPEPEPEPQPAPPPAPIAPVAPPPPPPPPPVARFSNIVTYDGAFEPVKNQMGQILGQSLNEVMRLRARAAEAFERKAEEMLADLACTVLGRELRTDPADLANIISQMRNRMLGESAVQIRVSPEDAAFIQGPVIADPELGFGDLVFETDDGQIDMRLGTRLAALLRAQQVEL
jgi:hypothetical protein